MEYQKIINLLDNAPNQPIKFRTKNWVEMHDESHGMCNTGSQIKFKVLMLRLILCDFSYTYIPANGTITVEEAATGGGNKDIRLVFKNCWFAPFADCIS